MTYNANLNQLTNMSLSKWDGSDKIMGSDYSYTDNGLIFQNNDQLDTTYSRTYSYNYRNQLTSMWSNYNQWSYSYDNWGNLTNGLTFAKIGASQTPVNNRDNPVAVVGLKNNRCKGRNVQRSFVKFT